MDKSEGNQDTMGMKCFIIRRYHDDTNYAYTTIKDCLRLLNVECIRGDIGTSNTAIENESERKQERSINELKDNIRNSTFVIADISDFPIKKDRNGNIIRKEFIENVYFEIGYASASNRPIVLMKDVKKCRLMGKLPFAIRDLPIICFQQGLSGSGLCILLESLIELKDAFKERIKPFKKSNVPDGRWSGDYSIKNSLHRVQMEKYDEEDYLCTLNITQNNIEYEIKELLVFHRKREKGWKEFRAMAYYNVIEEKRLDYLLDGYLLKLDLNGELIAKVWDNENNDGENPMFRLLPVVEDKVNMAKQQISDISMRKSKNTEKEYDVFVSHSSKDNNRVNEIYNYLVKKYKVFADFKESLAGMNWSAKIDNAIKNSKMMLVVFSKNYNDSKQTDRELSLADRYNIPILPLRLSDAEMTGTKSYILTPLHWIDMEKNLNSVLEKLSKNINELIDTSFSSSSPHKQITNGIITLCCEGVEFKMIYVEGGRFTMGATSEQGNDICLDEVPIHSVILSDFWIGETVVTQELWEKIMGNNPSYFKGAQLPVESVSWHDVNKFMEKINLKTGKKFRLLTEAEWEFAARGGNKSCHYKYSGSNDAQEVGWTINNSDLRTHEVKNKQCNELGIYDMTGNVWEWVSDWKGQYSLDSQIDPQGPKTGEEKECRGGAWLNHEIHLRVAQRNGNKPDTSVYYIGFRLALSSEK